MHARLAGKHFIPFRKADLLPMCLSDERLAEGQHQAFRQLYKMLSANFHFEFHAQLEKLKDLYAPDNPDSDTLPAPLSQVPEQDPADTLVVVLQNVLKAANYLPITDADLRQALTEESLFKVRLAVNFEDFDEVVFFRRGESRKRETVKQWFGLRSREIEFTNYARILVYARFRDAAHFAAGDRKNLMFKPGTTVLKLFQNVPKADLEMLFPNTEVRMRTLDKLLIGVPAAAGSIAMIVTKLSGTLLLVGSVVAFWLGLRQQPVSIDQTALITLAVGLGGFGAYLFRQFSKFKNRKIGFMKALTDNLYFRNLDNNAGVFNRLIDEAEDEECKEALLAYFALLLAGSAQTEAELDAWVESWFESRWQCGVDFEAADALAKLQRLELVKCTGDRFQAVALDEGLRRLDARWDGFFHHS